MSINYPTSLDTNTELYHVIDNIDYVYAVHHNALKDAVIALETVIGVTGSFNFTTESYVTSSISTHAGVTDAHHTKYTDAEVEAIITAELVDGQSIDNAIDSLISTHATNADAHHAESHTLNSHSGTLDATSLSDWSGLPGPTPATNDQILMEDFSDSWAKYKTTIGDIEGILSLANLASRSHSDLSDAPTDAHHVAYTDSDAEAVITAELVDGQSIDNAIDALISTHASNSDIHHAESHTHDSHTGTLSASEGGTGQTVFAVGDILYADTTTTLALLGKGNDGDILELASGLPSWVTPSGGTTHTLDSSTHSDVAAMTEAEGDIIYRNSSGYWTNLAKGSDNQFLRMNGNVPNWESVTIPTAYDVGGPYSSTTGSNTFSGGSTSETITYWTAASYQRGMKTTTYSFTLNNTHTTTTLNWTFQVSVNDSSFTTVASGTCLPLSGVSVGDSSTRASAAGGNDIRYKMTTDLTTWNTTSYTHATIRTAYALENW